MQCLQSPFTQSCNHLDGSAFAWLPPRLGIDKLSELLWTSITGIQ